MRCSTVDIAVKKNQILERPVTGFFLESRVFSYDASQAMPSAAPARQDTGVPALNTREKLDASHKQPWPYWLIGDTKVARGKSFDSNPPSRNHGATAPAQRPTPHGQASDFPAVMDNSSSKTSEGSSARPEARRKAHATRRLHGDTRGLSALLLQPASNEAERVLSTYL